jgi:hypothetical protein
MLIAQPTARTFWTLSAWTGEDAIDAFIGEQPHRDVMTEYHDRLDAADFTTWAVSARELPRARSNARELWDDGKRRLAATRT